MSTTRGPADVNDHDLDLPGPSESDHGPEAYVERVLRLVEQVPPGRVTTYGDLAAASGRGGPRQAGRVLALYGATVCWWRVVRADGQPARGHETQAWQRLAAERVPRRGDRVDLARARWTFGDHGDPAADES